MSDTVLKTENPMKRIYQAYRRVAQLVIDFKGEQLEWAMPIETRFIVNPNAPVMPMDDGAYVELSMWVPRKVAEALLAEEDRMHTEMVERQRKIAEEEAKRKAEEEAQNESGTSQ